MTVTWYPKNIVAGLALFAAFLFALKLAVTVQQGLAVGVGAVVAYAVIDMVLSVNPAVWQGRNKTSPPRS